uniref:Uncharacterized protein n=1 Tax=Arundo donax TaxID=35708 RepID=A0A0A9E2I5_ARUDO
MQALGLSRKPRLFARLLKLAIRVALLKHALLSDESKSSFCLATLELLVPTCSLPSSCIFFFFFTLPGVDSFGVTFTFFINLSFITLNRSTPLVDFFPHLRGVDSTLSGVWTGAATPASVPLATLPGCCSTLPGVSHACAGKELDSCVLTAQSTSPKSSGADWDRSSTADGTELNPPLSILPQPAGSGAGATAVDRAVQQEPSALVVPDGRAGFRTMSGVAGDIPS